MAKNPNYRDGTKNFPHVCARVACNRKAEFLPRLGIYPLLKGGTYTGPPAEIIFPLPLCKKHSHEAQPENFITDEGWEIIKGVFAERGLAEPDRDRIEVKKAKIKDVLDLPGMKEELTGGSRPH